MKLKAGALIRKLEATGFFHIFVSSVFGKIISFLSSFVLVRIISKSEYGIYTYANNILSFFLLLNGFGMVSGTMQLCSEKIDETNIQKKIYQYGCNCSMLINIFLSVIILFFSLIVELPIKGSSFLLGTMFLVPLFRTANDLQEIYMRVQLKNKEYSYSLILNAIATLTFSVLGGILFNALGLIIGRYIAYFLLIVVMWLLFKAPILLGKVQISKLIKQNMWKISSISMLNNALNEILYIIDIFVIGIMLGDGQIVATYKVATIIPVALTFIPSSLVTYIYPHFAKNKDNKKWVKDNYLKLTAFLGIFNLIIVLGGILYSNWLIRFLFGLQYLDMLIPFRILMVSYFFSGTFKVLAGNILVTQRKLKANFVIYIFSSFVNILGDFIFVAQYGAIGASMVTLAVMALTGITSCFYLLYSLDKHNI